MEWTSLLSSMFDWRLLGGVLLLVFLVLLFAYVSEKNKKDRKTKPGWQLEYTVPGKNATACRELLQKNDDQDIFVYNLEPTPQGGWFFNLKEHRPSGQVLDTLYLLTFDANEPAGLSLRFVREAFAQRDPIVSRDLLDAFFLQKLGAIPQNTQKVS